MWGKRSPPARQERALTPSSRLKLSPVGPILLHSKVCGRVGRLPPFSFRPHCNLSMPSRPLLGFDYGNRETIPESSKRRDAFRSRPQGAEIAEENLARTLRPPGKDSA